MQKYYQNKEENSQTIPRIEYEKELNAAQLDVVIHGDGYSLVLAGAGSGKTRTLVYRVAWLVESGIPANCILLLTFTNKAAKEMLSRVSALVECGIRDVWGGTFHHVAHRILRKYASRIGFRDNFQILDEDDAERVMKNALASLHDSDAPSALPKIDALRRVLSYTRNRMQRIHETIEDRFPHFSMHESLLEDLARTYQEKKQLMNVMDFDDLLVFCVHVLQHHEDARTELAQQFQYVLVDEYQDTNRLQAAMASLLSSCHKNLLVVGDDAQSIYSFRAADIANILTFAKEYPTTHIFRLETNYRSYQEILTLANESITHNETRHKKELRGIRTGNTQRPVLAATANPEMQATYITEQIRSRVREGTQLQDIAVLFRASFQTRELELILAQHDIPYVKRGGLRYFEQAHVKDVLSFLRIVENPSDELAWKRALTLYQGVGERTAARVWQEVGMETYQWMQKFEQLLNDRGVTSRAQQSLTDAWSDLADLGTSTQTPGDMIRAILDRRYRAYVIKMYDDAEDRLLDLDTLAGFADGYASIRDLLADAALGEEFRGEKREDTHKEVQDLLVLSTIHQAKGLEWNTVFVMGLSEGQFPHPRSFGKSEELEEERRLFYVAVTRAKDRLFLTYTEQSFRADGYYLSRPSLFVRELPKNSYQRHIM